VLMRTVRRNKQKLWYSLQTDEQIPVYEKDSDGNTKYEGYEDSDGNFIPILDDDGNKIPIETGEYDYKYATPVIFYANINEGGSKTSMKVWGIDESSYDATAEFARGAYPLTETSVVWFKTEPKYEDDEKTIPDEKSADYQVVKVVDSLNYTTVVLKRRVK